MGVHFPSVLRINFKLRVVVARRQQLVELSITGPATQHEVSNRVVGEATIKSEASLVGVAYLRFHWCLGKLVSAAELERMRSDRFGQIVGSCSNVVMCPPWIVAAVDGSPSTSEA